MAKRKQTAGVDRGKQQSALAESPGKVLSASFRKNSDDGPVTRRVRAARAGNKKPANVTHLPRQFQEAAAILQNRYGK